MIGDVLAALVLTVIFAVLLLVERADRRARERRARATRPDPRPTHYRIR